MSRELSGVKNAECGVSNSRWRIHSSSSRQALMSGDSTLAGSCGNTSRPAARTVPSFIASCRASTSTIAPRAVFTRINPFLAEANASRPINFRVASLDGACTLTTSLCANNSAIESARLMPRASSEPLGLCGSKKTTFMPNAFARKAAAVPIRPKPTTPKVQTESRLPNGLRAGIQLPVGSFLSRSSWKAILFIKDNISAIA